MKLICTIMPRSLSVPSLLPLDEAVKMLLKLMYLTMPRSLSVAMNTSAACMIMPRSLSVPSTLRSSLIVAFARQVLVLRVCYLPAGVNALDEAVKT